MLMRTWIWEMIVVGIVLSAVALFFSNDLAGWLTTAAILATFGHAQIGDRMQERQSMMESPSVECHWKMNYYFVGKEVLWISMFLVVKNYPAIIGSALFILYPKWRKWWRKKKPIDAGSSTSFKIKARVKSVKKFTPKIHLD